MTWHIIGIVIVAVLYNIYRYYHDDEDNDYSPVSESSAENNQVEVSNMEETINTSQLFLKTIENIGSMPQYDEDGGIQFEYQGITFLMEAVDECLFVNLIWPWCHSFSKFDIDELSRVRKVINDINMKGTVSVLYSIADSDDVALHIKKNFLFVKQIPDLEGYLKLMLDSFFRTARTLELEIEKCRLQECENA